MCGLRLLSALGLFVLLAACGDDDDGSSSPPVPDASGHRDSGGGADTDAGSLDSGDDVQGPQDVASDVEPEDAPADTLADATSDTGVVDVVDDAEADSQSDPDGGQPTGELLPLPTALATFYVSSSLGNDAWTGSLPEPNGDSSDGPKASLDAALSLLDGASPGTHVLLRRGDSWSPSDGLVVGAATGTDQDPVVLGAYGSGSQPEIVAQHTGNVFTVRGNANGTSSWFRMDDLRITAASEVDGQVGIYIGESWHPEVPHHITFSHLTIEHLGAGMTMYGDNHLVHGCRIAHNNFGMGIFVTGNDLRFRYNEFEDNGLPPPDVFVHSLYISNCDGVVFEHNEVHSATDGVKVRRTHRGVFRHNTFHDIVNFGIHLGGDSEGGAEDNRIEANVFYRNTGDIVIKSESGVQTDLVDGLVIANNIVQAGPAGAPSGYGYSISLTDVPARNVSVVNNLLFDLGQAHGIRVGNSGAGITCANNIVAKLTAGEAFDIDASVAQGGNLEARDQGALDGLRLSDPANLDFTPTAESAPLIDQGVDVSNVLTVDFDGNTRPIGAAFDIGPFEYAPPG